MERQLYARLCEVVWSLSRGHRRAAKTRFSDAVIVLTYLWAVVHDRPVDWATKRSHWPVQKRGHGLPSQSTMSRRLRSKGVQGLMDKLMRHLRGASEAGQLKAVDGKPLEVGRFSHDKQARWGYASKGYARGYKLHALWAQSQALPLRWEVRPMNDSESTVAEGMIEKLKDRGVVLADAAYDVDRLFVAAQQHGHQLLTMRRFPRKRLSVNASAARVAGTRMMRRHNVRRLYARRLFIEQNFGQLTSPGGGLGPLPAWVRTLGRVRLWVHAKLILHGLRVQLRQAA